MAAGVAVNVTERQVVYCSYFNMPTLDSGKCDINRLSTTPRVSPATMGTGKSNTFKTNKTQGLKEQILSGLEARGRYRKEEIWIRRLLVSTLGVFQKKSETSPVSRCHLTVLTVFMFISCEGGGEVLPSGD